MLAQQSGKLIHQARLEKGLTQAELSRRAGVSRTVLSRLEQGKAEVVQTDVLDRLFDTLGSQPQVGDSDKAQRRMARLEQARQLEANRTRHLRLAVALASDPQAARPLIAKAKARLKLWRAQKTCSPTFVEGWAKVLSLPPDRLALAMASFDDWEDAMFQNSPWSWAWN